MSVVIDGSSGITTNSGTVVSTTDATLNGLTVGKGGGSVTQNTVVGASAGSANTTGKITAVGYLAARFNTTGSGNTAIGGNDGAQDGALYYNTTGNYNIAMGTGAVASNTTGSNNTGLGYQALNGNTTASNNTSVGYQAGYTNSTGPHNTFVGTQAGYSSTGGENTCVGRTAGYSISTGTGNTFIGPGNGATSNGAGYYVTTGSKNSIIGGYNGNQGGLDIRTASNYIVLSDGDGNPRMYCDNNGRFYIYTQTIYNTASTNIGFAGNVGSGISINSTTNTNGATYEVFLTTGTLIGSISNNNNTGISYNTTSDYRLKENVKSMVGALDTVAQLKPVTYTWKSNGSDGQGFIAHELADVVPHAVTGEKDAVNENGSIKPQQIDTSFLVATLTAAIQELKALVDAQATEIAELKAKVR